MVLNHGADLEVAAKIIIMKQSVDSILLYSKPASLIREGAIFQYLNHFKFVSDNVLNFLGDRFEALMLNAQMVRECTVFFCKINKQTNKQTILFEFSKVHFKFHRLLCARPRWQF